MPDRLQAGARWGGLQILEPLPGAAELEVPLYRARGDDGQNLVLAPLAGLGATAEAAYDRVAALYDRALRLAHVEHRGLAKLSESMAPGLPEPLLAWAAPPGGRTARELLANESPLAPTRAARIALEAAEAIEAIHAAGEVHGGLCPANVLVREAGGTILLGVGTSTTRPGASATSADVARYRAPEQLGFVRGAIDPRTDVFALGALLYELLNGEPAFPAPSLAALRAAMAAGPPESLGYRFAGLGGALPEPLARALAGALQPEPTSRLRTAGEVAAPLRELLAAADPAWQGATGHRPLAPCGHETAPAAPPPRRERRRSLALADEPLPVALWLLPAAALLGLAALLAWWLR